MYYNFDIPCDENNLPPLNNTTVDFCNISSGTIGSFTPVALTGAYGDESMQLSRCCGHAIFTGIPAVDDSVPWAIALDDIEPGNSGRAVISGIAPAYFSGNGKYALPSNAGLTAGESGNALILLEPLQLSGSRTLPGLILLGGASSVIPENSYYGYFKLVALSTVSVKIINGYDSASSYCGATDIPGLNTIPVTELLLDDKQEWKIYLAFFYDTDTKTYSAEFVTGLPGTEVFSQLLGTFRRGKVDQIYRLEPGIGRMIFGEDWYLK